MAQKTLRLSVPDEHEHRGSTLYPENGETVRICGRKKPETVIEGGI